VSGSVVVIVIESVPGSVVDGSVVDGSVVDGSVVDGLVIVDDADVSDDGLVIVASSLDSVSTPIGPGWL